MKQAGRRNRTLDRFLALLLALVVLAGIALGCFFFGSKNDWRLALEARIGQTLQGQATIAGSITPSLNHGTGLILHDITVVQDGHAVLIVPALRLTVDPWALLAFHLRVTRVAIDGATLNLPLAMPVAADIQSTASVTDAPHARRLNMALQKIIVTDLLVVPDDSSHARDLRLHYAALALNQGATLDIDMELAGHRLVGQLHADDLARLQQGLRQPFSAALALDHRHHILLTGQYGRHQTLTLLDDIAIDVDGIKLTGRAAADMDTGRPAFAANLNIAQLDLAAIVPVAPAKVDAGAAAPSVAPMFSNAALPWAWLPTLDGAVTLQVGQILRGQNIYGPGYLQIALDRGLMSAVAIAQPPGSRQPLHVDLIADAPTRKLEIRTQHFTLDPAAIAGLMGRAPFLLAPLTLDADIMGQGASLHEIAASAGGSALLQATAGQLVPEALPKGLRHALELIFTSGRLQQANFACFKTQVDVTGGIAVTHIGLDSDLMQAAGGGQLRLGDEQADLALVIAPQIAALSGVRIPLTVKGKLGDPAVGTDALATGTQLASKLAGKVFGFRFGATTGERAEHAVMAVGASKIDMPPNICQQPAAATTAAAAPAALPTDSITQPTGLAGMLSVVMPPDMQAQVVHVSGLIAGPMGRLLGLDPYSGSAP